MESPVLLPEASAAAPDPAATGRAETSKPRRSWPAGVLVLFDVIALVLAALSARAGRAGAVYGLGVLASVMVAGGYRSRASFRPSDRTGQVLAALVVPVLPLAAVGAGAIPGRLAPLVACAGVLMLGGRAVVSGLVRSAGRRRVLAEPTLIVGGGAVGEQLARCLIDHPEHGLVPVGFVESSPVAGSQLPAVAPDRLHDAVSDLGIRCVIVAFGSAPDSELVDALRACHEAGVDVRVVPRFFELGQSRSLDLDDIRGMPVRRLPRVGRRAGLAWRGKRALDIMVSVVMLVVSASVLAVAAVAVKATSRGPVLFRQNRVGQGGRTFELLKFRSMAVNDDCEVTWSVRRDDRITPVGRVLRATSLDELPQLINVLRGEMSLVGPRPERPHFVKRFGSEVPRYGDRHRVPVGLTGLSQVHGLRGDTSIDERVLLDNRYIDEWTFLSDVGILLRTPLALVKAVVGALRGVDADTAACEGRITRAQRLRLVRGNAQATVEDVQRPLTTRRGVAK